MHRAPSPYRSTSPFAPQLLDRQYSTQKTLPTGTAQVGPGAWIVVCEPGPDGRMTYQRHTAVSASYQTPSGIVSGIQWIPTEPASYAPPSGRYVSVSGKDPSTWGAVYLSTMADWQRGDENNRKYEDIEIANRHREQARSHAEYERLSRSRDPQMSGKRDRSRSFGAGGAAPSAAVPFPVQGVHSAYPIHPTVAAGYPTNPYSQYPMGPPPPPVIPSGYPSGFSTHNRNPSNSSFSEITRQLKEIELDRNREHAESRSRKSSSSGRSRSESSYGRSRTISGNYADRPIPNASSNPYPQPPGAYPSGQPYGIGIPTKTQSNYPDPYPPTSRYGAPSPNMRPSDIASSFGTASSGGYPGSNYSPPSRNPADLIARSTTPFGNPPPQVYPRGHILEGQPIINNMMPQPRSRAPSRAPSPNPSAKSSSYMGKSPHIPFSSFPAEPQQLAAPEAFSRPINVANSFAPFDLIRIEDMDDIYDPPYPKMPPILTTHDIYHEDWKRCMQDLGRSWTGQLPVPGLAQDGHPPRKSTLAADLISLWNHSFFFPRGVELLLYKGRERRTGPQAGQPAVRLPHFDDADDSSSSSSSSSSSDSGRSSYGKRLTDPYGRPLIGRHEEKQEKKRRRREKKARRKAKAQEKTYTVYVGCLPQARGPPAIPFNARPGAVQGGLGPPPAIPVGYAAPTYGAPNASSAYGVPNSSSSYGAPNSSSAYGASNASSGYGAPNATPAYGAPVGIPTARSHGYGGGY